MSIVFYRDKPNNFSCGIKINGASLSESKARLILAFPNKSVMFNGKISSKGEVSIDIPAIKESHDSGQATLEIIADSMLFEAWKSQFNIKSQRNIQVESVSVNQYDDKKIVIENVNANLDKQISKQKSRILKKNVSEKNKKIISKILEMYSPNSLKISDFKDKKIKNWISDNFRDPSTSKALFCGMVLENRLKRIKEK